MRKTAYYCKISFQTAPFVFLLNILYVVLAALARFGVTYSFKYIANYVVSYSDKQIVLYAFLFLFVCNMISGNNSNFTEMLNFMCIKKVKIIFYKAFMKQAYEQKQDDFYDSEFYNNYEFIKENIDSAMEICLTIWNKLLGVIVSLILAITAITIFSHWMLLVMLFCSVLMIVINRYSVRSKVTLNKQLIPEERKANYYSELLAGRKHAKELRIFGLRDLFLKKWRESYLAYISKKYKLERKLITYSKLPIIIQQILSVILTIYFLSLVNAGKMTVGDFTFLFGMMMILMQEMNNLIDIFSKEIIEKLEYIDAFEKFVHSIHSIEKKDEGQITSYGQRFDQEEFKELVVKDLCYAYPNQNAKALNGINVTIKKGEIVCLLGYNGSGKSTFSKLICGILEDYQGEILINGYNIKKVDKESVFKKFGIGFQDYTKYALSLKDNIKIGRIEDASETSIQKAVEQAGLQDLIQRLPEQAETILGKEYDRNGQDLSGGQWQKIILARAYMGEPDFFILDEPTAAVDPIGEMEILGQFRKIINGKTALLISHRIGFAKMADRILFMNQGVIVEDGSHEQLMRCKGQYYTLFQAQKQLYE